MSGFWLRRSVYPLCERATGRRILAKWRELERTQWLSPRELLELQAQRLQALLKHAYDTVPYYRQILDRSGIAPAGVRRVADLGALPLLTKQIIRERQHELVSNAFPPSRRLPNHTGGSTGTPLHFVQDRRQRDWGSANKLRCNRWAGWDFGKRVLRLWGYPRDLGRAQTAIGRLRNLAFRERLLDAFRFTERDLAGVISPLRRRRPQVIVGYASMIVHLTEFVAERPNLDLSRIGRIRMRLRPAGGIISSADMLLPYQRARVESVLRAPVFDRYGCREVDTIAAECDRHQGLHVNVDRLVVEYLDEAHRPVPPGQPGRVVVTDLFNYAMPFIRYDVGDLATPSGALCECGRGLPLLSELVGRFADVLTTPEGAYVSVSALSTILAEVPGLDECQFVQKAADRLVVRVVPRPSYMAESETVFRQRLSELFGSRIQITFEYVDTLARTSSGKARLSVSEISSRS